MIEPLEKPVQPRNPLHGMTLENIVKALADHYGWEGLGERIPVRASPMTPAWLPASSSYAKPPGREIRWKVFTFTCCVMRGVPRRAPEPLHSEYIFFQEMPCQLNRSHWTLPLCKNSLA